MYFFEIMEYYYTIFTLVGFCTCGALSLTLITLDRLFGIVIQSIPNLQQFKRIYIYAILIGIWICAFAAGLPSIMFRIYKVS